MQNSKHTDVDQQSPAQVLSQNGSKEKRLTRHERLLIAQLLKNLPYHRLKYIVAYLQKMLSKPR